VFTFDSIHQQIEKVPPVVPTPKKEDAQYKFTWFTATGSGIFLAAILGDAVNYHAGKYIGPRVFKSEPGSGSTWLERALNRKHLERAHEFFERYGGKAVILGRFVPIVRTFVPFVAGAGAMNYSKFFLYNVLGAILWVGICIGAGWYFGGFEWVKKNFEMVVVAIIVISLVPVAIELVLGKRRADAAARGKP
jgi:membrane-associated protein